MLTPKRPEATCLIAERRESPFVAAKRTGSSPPSPVFDWPPMRFIAIASVSCASRESEPSDIAPVEKRLTISLAGSTSSSGIAAVLGEAEAQQAAQRQPPRRVVVDEPRVLLVGLAAAVAHRVLEQRDRLRVPLVVLAVARARRRGRRPAAARRARRVGARVAGERLAREHLDADAADARRRCR